MTCASRRSASSWGWPTTGSVLGSEVWWSALANTLLIVGVSVALELLLGFALALVMHRALVARVAVRAAVLVPYAIVTVVAALAWRFAFDPITGFVNAWFGLEQAWLAERWSAFLVIIGTEVWKTTPFVALLLLAGLTLVPRDLLLAARVDGASAWQRLIHITLPLMRPAILVALLFRTLDAFRIFDTVYVQTRGGAGYRDGIHPGLSGPDRAAQSGARVRGGGADLPGRHGPCPGLSRGP